MRRWRGFMLPGKKELVLPAATPYMKRVRRPGRNHRAVAAESHPPRER
jgi:hypothetical protein